MDEAPSWRTCAARPAPAELVATLRAKVSGEPWNSLAEAGSAVVDVLLTPSEIVISAPSGPHIALGRQYVTLSGVFDCLGALTIATPGGTVVLKAPGGDRALFAEALGREYNVAGGLTEQHNQSGRAEPPAGDPALLPNTNHTASALAGGDVLPPPPLPPDGERVAEAVLGLALANPKVRWWPPLQYALMTSCLIDLEYAGRLTLDEDGSLLASDGTLTGSPAHDLVLRRVVTSRCELMPCTWLFRLAAEVARTLLDDALVRDAVRQQARRGWSVWTRRKYTVTDSRVVAELTSELQRAFDGSSVDVLATTVLTVCAATGLRELVPTMPSLKALRRRTEQLPSSPITDSIRENLRKMRPMIEVPGGG